MLDIIPARSRSSLKTNAKTENLYKFVQFFNFAELKHANQAIVEAGFDSTLVLQYQNSFYIKMNIKSGREKLLFLLLLREEEGERKKHLHIKNIMIIRP